MPCPWRPLDAHHHASVLLRSFQVRKNSCLACVFPCDRKVARIRHVLPVVEKIEVRSIDPLLTTLVTTNMEYHFVTCKFRQDNSHVFNSRL
ncbi:MAG: hypothetical protein [Circoviridae sp.]|nr:MAG: hypothetical protein [Circoviridae sp.]